MCLRAGLLENSHLIPASVYKRFYSQNAPNPNPMLISSRGFVQTSRQTKAYLLCSDCESLLNREGERWVLPLIANPDQSFPLYDILARVPPDSILPEITAFAAVRNSEINVQALTHFALGIFWKAAVHYWIGGKKETQIKLGPYEERLREFVHSPRTGPLPDGIALLIAVLPPPKISMLADIPNRGPNGDGFHNFRFYVPGIQFILSVGNGIDHETCFQSNPLHPICLANIADQVERGPRRLYIEAMQRSTQVKKSTHRTH